RARRTAPSSSRAPARRWSGRSKCTASTRMRRSTGWRRRARSMRRCPRRSGARWRPFTPAVEAEPWIAALADYIEQNDAALRAVPNLFPRAEVELLTTKSRAAHAHIRPLIVERGDRGLVRRLHGDLPLGNIVLLGGRPVAFDAIEFSALIASGDVLYDLAFLLMGLVERRLEPAA